MVEPISPEMWDAPDMLKALACRDIGTVFGLLKRWGIPQSQIAAIVGMSPSEVSDVVAGRQVRNYRTLARIADQFGIPRGKLGLGTGEPGGGHEEDDEDVKRRKLLHLAVAAVSGVALPAYGRDADLDALWHADKLNSTDVDQLWKLQQELTRLGEQFGSVPCHTAMRALTQRAYELRQAEMSEYTRGRLLAFLARVYGSLGWSAADCGQPSEARDHFERSLTFCRETGDRLQLARTLSFAGRSALQWTGPDEALKVLSFASLAAEQARSNLFRATISAHGAQAYALAGHERQARDAVSRSYDHYGNVDAATDGAAWYPVGDITSAAAATWHALGKHDRAVECAEGAVSGREDYRLRSHAFRYSRLSLFSLAAGDKTAGIAAGREAVRCASQVRSERVKSRIGPVADWAARYQGDEDTRDLARDVRRVASGAASLA